MAVVVASARTEIAGFLESLIFVYVLIIIGYIITSLVFSFGVRVPYSRPVNAVLEFFRDVAEPWLRIFRRLPLRIGPLDLTPIVAILALQIGGNIIVALVRGG
jgi:YggT family protein